MAARSEAWKFKRYRFFFKLKVTNIGYLPVKVPPKLLQPLHKLTETNKTDRGKFQNFVYVISTSSTYIIMYLVISWYFDITNRNIFLLHRCSVDA